MTESTLYPWLLMGWYGLSVGVFILLLNLSAPYGRHERSGWGPSIPSVLGWVVMELPAVVVPLLCVWMSSRPSESVALFALSLWQVHYLHRTFIYPLRMRMSGKTMPLFIALTGCFTNVVVNYLVWRWWFSLGSPSSGWFSVCAGTCLFVLGFGINRHSDHILRGLRVPGETGYRVPHGGLYRFVSCPNYLGELLQWAGFAILGGSASTWIFVVWSAANLVPRAMENHRWYQRTFDSYPGQRRALIPFVL